MTGFKQENDIWFSESLAGTGYDNLHNTIMS